MPKKPTATKAPPKPRKKRKSKIDTSFGHLFAEISVRQEDDGILIGIKANDLVTPDRRQEAAKKLHQLSGSMLPRLLDGSFKIFLRKEGDIQGPGFDVAVSCPNAEQTDVLRINGVMTEVLAELTADILPDAKYLLGTSPDVV